MTSFILIFAKEDLSILEMKFARSKNTSKEMNKEKVLEKLEDLQTV